MAGLVGGVQLLQSWELCPDFPFFATQVCLFLAAKQFFSNVSIVEAGTTPYLVGAHRPIMGHRKAAATPPNLKSHIIN
jgi:hypothetical protein